MVKERTKQIYVHFDTSTHAKISKLANEGRRSKTKQVELMVDEWIKANKAKNEIEGSPGREE